MVVYIYWTPYTVWAICLALWIIFIYSLCVVFMRSWSLSLTLTIILVIKAQPWFGIYWSQLGPHLEAPQLRFWPGLHTNQALTQPDESDCATADCIYLWLLLQGRCRDVCAYLFVIHNPTCLTESFMGTVLHEGLYYWSGEDVTLTALSKLGINRIALTISRTMENGVLQCRFVLLPTWSIA